MNIIFTTDFTNIVFFGAGSVFSDKSSFFLAKVKILLVPLNLMQLLGT